MQIARERLKKEKELDAGTVADLHRLQREIEVESQIVNAIELGNDFDLLWTSPAGINPKKNKGCCPMRHATMEQEESWCRLRFAELKARFDAGEEYAEIDAVLASEEAAGRATSKLHDELSEIKTRTQRQKRGEEGTDPQKFARARAHKDFRQAMFRQFLRDKGALVPITDAELKADLEARTEMLVGSVNEVRKELGLKKVKLVETEE
ncbi:MAG: hypothetical protein WC565_08770 [Parcubacteria group bacterium]|jgi:hypothetical protein